MKIQGGTRGFGISQMLLGLTMSSPADVAKAISTCPSRYWLLTNETSIWMLKDTKHYLRELEDRRQSMTPEFISVHSSAELQQVDLHTQLKSFLSFVVHPWKESLLLLSVRGWVSLNITWISSFVDTVYICSKTSVPVQKRPIAYCNNTSLLNAAPLAAVKWVLSSLKEREKLL